MRDDDYDSDYRDSHDSYGHNSHSGGYGGGSSYASSHSATGKDHKVDTSKLVSTMIDDDGRFLGMQLSSELAQQARQIFSTALPILADKGEDYAVRFLGTQNGAKYGKYFGFGIALSEQILGTLQNAFALVSSLNQLNATVKPLAKAASKDGTIVPLAMNNEVIASARSKIFAVFSQRTVDTVVGLITAAPAIHTVFQKTRAKIKTHEELKDFQAALSSPQELANYHENKKYGSGKTGVHKGMTPTQIRQAEDIYVDVERAKYRKSFDKFKEDKFKGLKKELETEIGKLKYDNCETQLRVLKDLGLETEQLSQGIKYAETRADRDHEMYIHDSRHNKDAAKPESLEQRIRERIEKYAKEIKEDINKQTERALRKQYVRNNGAFDGEWAGHGENNQLTIEQELRKEARKNIEENERILREKEKEEALGGKKDWQDGGLFKQTLNGVLGFGAGLVREVTQRFIGGKALEQLKKPIASDRIVHLIQVLEQPKDAHSDWEPPREVPPISNKGNGRKSRDEDGLNDSVSYARYIHEIFQQHQKDHKWAEVGVRFVPHFDKARWDDEKIQQMADDELTPYEYAVKTIANRIKTGRMAAAALVYLVGDPHGKKIVHSDGRSFGPKGAGKDDASVKAGMLKVIDEYSAILHPEKEVSAEQISERMGNLLVGVPEIKAFLESKDTPAPERAFVFKLFSDLIGSDAVLCEKLSIKNERCQELRKESREFNLMLDGVMDVLSKKLDKDPEGLEKTLKVTDKEKELLASLKERQREQGGHTADVTTKREELQELSTLALNTAMTLGAKHAEFWKDVKQAMAESKKAREAAAQAQKDGHHAGKPSRSKGRKSADAGDDPWEEESKAAGKARRFSPFGSKDKGGDEAFAEHEPSKKWASGKSARLGGYASKGGSSFQDRLDDEPVARGIS